MDPVISSIGSRCVLGLLWLLGFTATAPRSRHRLRRRRPAGSCGWLSILTFGPAVTLKAATPGIRGTSTARERRLPTSPCRMPMAGLLIAGDETMTMARASPLSTSNRPGDLGRVPLSAVDCAASRPWLPLPSGDGPYAMAGPAFWALDIERSTYRSALRRELTRQAAPFDDYFRSRSTMEYDVSG